MIEGKTYTLFGKGNSSQSFYDEVSSLCDELLDRFSWKEIQMAGYIRKQSENRRKLKKSAGRDPESSEISYILNRCHEVLQPFTMDIEKHLDSVPIHQHLTDPELLTNREQYYLYMLEFELENRLNRQAFARANYRIALLPYCLKESHTTCRASKDGIEYECKACLKTCFINKASRILKEHDVDPYILSRGRISKLLKDLMAEHGSVGVLGIACLAELIAGMRLCIKAGLPVLGIPLDANRCGRWLEEMKDTSVDLQAFERLVNK